MLKKIFLLSLFSLNFNTELLGAAKNCPTLASLKGMLGNLGMIQRNPVIRLMANSQGCLPYVPKFEIRRRIDDLYIESYWPRVDAFRDLVFIKTHDLHVSEAWHRPLSRIECGTDVEFEATLKEVQDLTVRIKTTLSDLHNNVDAKLHAIKTDEKFEETLVRCAAWEAECARMRAMACLK